MKKLIVIGGPTACGKTDLAIQLALHFNTVILSADSRQCYKELNIGVAKPDAHQLQQAPHFFINSHSIHDTVNAGVYERCALDILNTLFQEHQTVICVGGTGLYIRALCQGVDEMPTVDENIRQSLTQKYEQLGLAWLQTETQKADPEFYQSVDTANPNRLLRGLSFIQSTGHSILHYRIALPKKRDFDIEAYYINPPRELVYERINQRVDVMIQDGLEQEVTSLIAFRNEKNLQTVGYQEWWSYFDQQASKGQVIDLIKQHTRHYAKRQLTWFRNDPMFHAFTTYTTEEMLAEYLHRKEI